MTVYHINKGIGRASSGIEYAQKYRFDLVKDFKEKQYFVYCDCISSNLITFTDKIGIDQNYVLSAYKFLAGQKNRPSSLTVEAYVKNLPDGYKEIEKTDRAVVYENGIIRHKIWLVLENGMVDRVDLIVDKRLQEVHYFTDRLTSIEYYSNGEVNSRYFYDEAGSLSMRQYYANKEITLTMIGDKVLQGRSAFYTEFFNRLNFTNEDLIIVDRNQDLGDALFPAKKDAKMIVVVHAEHFSQSVEVDDWILWNNFYEYPFTNAKHVDRFIVSTLKQEETLREQFDLIATKDNGIVTIPVGSIPEIADGSTVEANKYKFLTASRLAWEKHIDVLVKAVVKAKVNVPELTFSIYGSGKYEKDIRDLIKELNAGDYITMEGHKNLTDEYKKFGGYLTASGSEGFGLTILEAKGACLPIVGLDVNYGNTEFVKSGVNGILVEKNEEDEQIENIAAAIFELTSNLDYQASVKFDQEKVADFTNDAVRGKWRDLYDELIGGEK